MKKKSKTGESTRAEDMVRYMLQARMRENKRLREDVAGLEETLHLSEGFISLLLLALTGEKKALQGVKVCTQGAKGPEIFVRAKALAEGLKGWHIEAVRQEDGYLISFFQDKTEV